MYVIGGTDSTIKEFRDNRGGFRLSQANLPGPLENDVGLVIFNVSKKTLHGVYRSRNATSTEVDFTLVSALELTAAEYPFRFERSVKLTGCDARSLVTAFSQKEVVVPTLSDQFPHLFPRPTVVPNFMCAECGVCLADFVFVPCGRKGRCATCERADGHGVCDRCPSGTVHTHLRLQH